MGALRDVTVVVFNQIDQLGPVDAARCRPTWRGSVEADGLPGCADHRDVPVTGEGLDESWSCSRRRVAGRRGRTGPARGELDDLSTRAGPAGRPGGAGDRRGPAIDREAVRELADEFATAVGVERVAAGRPRLPGPGQPCRAGRSAGPASRRTP